MRHRYDDPSGIEVYKTTKWLVFSIIDKKPKTVVVAVDNISGQRKPGEIRWHGPFRQYCFCVNTADHATLIFNNGCLEDIANVCTELNTAHQAKKNKE